MLQPKEIGIVAFDGVTASHLTTLVDAFSAACLEDGFGGRIACYRVWILGLGPESCATESGLTFHVRHSLQTAPPLDTIIIPGGHGLNHPVTRDRLAQWLLLRSPQLDRIGAICGGIHALAAAGILDGHEVTTHWRIASGLRRQYPNLRVDHKRAVIKDGMIYTAAGLTAGLDLALMLIEEDYGRQVALAVSRDLMLYLGIKETPNESPLPPEEVGKPSDRFGELVAWMLRHLDEHLTVEVMARRAGMSPTHFTKAFKAVFGVSPGRFVENLRVNEARRRLSSRGKTLRTVAASVGFPNTSAFTRAFQRRFGSSPRETRALLTAQPLPSRAG